MLAESTKPLAESSGWRLVSVAYAGDHVLPQLLARLKAEQGKGLLRGLITYQGPLKGPNRKPPAVMMRYYTCVL